VKCGAFYAPPSSSLFPVGGKRKKTKSEKKAVILQHSKTEIE